MTNNGSKNSVDAHAMKVDPNLFSRSNAAIQLLVSVRSVAEVDRAITGGTDILDVKDPSKGSIAMASIDDIVAITKRVAWQSPEIPVSIALGELRDWPMGVSIPQLPAEIHFVKLGLAGCSRQHDWRQAWQQLRFEFESRSCRHLNWVAVAYADAEAAGAPDFIEVIEAAIQTGCSGLLIDTWRKDGKTLLDHFSEDRLIQAAQRLHAVGLFFAIAGNLTLKSLAVISQIPVDIVGIRSAACVESRRTAELNADLIAQFRRTLQSQPAVDSIKQIGLSTAAR